MDDAAGRGELVVLVHGLWMGRAIWLFLARRLRRQGYRVASFAYPSVRQGLTESALALEAFVRARPAIRLHLVGHSLGGLVVLRMLRDARSAALARVVLLGCPVAGCSAAGQLGRSRTGRWLLGAALPQWTPAEAPPTVRRFETGAIAGTRRFGVGSVLLRLPRLNDGVVMVDETVLPGMADHLVLPVSHSGMVISGRVADEVGTFLRTGRFAHRSQAIARATPLV
ncbi:MAG TPA: alpha/beta fold hydrolase [Burkholderiales bacterium]|nr:alpha/beta fold hydrolase [Burkholderiales bacterium]